MTEFDTYIDLVNDIDQEIESYSFREILIEINYCIRNIYKIQKIYNKNKVVILEKLGRIYESQKDNDCKDLVIFDLDKKKKNKKKKKETKKKKKEKELIDVIFKKIAIKCHPDKTDDQYKNKIFVYANKSKKTINLLQLMYLIGKTDINDIEITDAQYSVIQRKIGKINSEIEEIKKTIPFLWEYLNPTQQEEYILNLKKEQEKKNN